MTAPLPPSDLASRTPYLTKVAGGEELHRFYSKAFEPLFFDQGTDGRLNATDGSYGVLYTAEAPNGAFAETFLRQPGRRIIPNDLLNKKAYVRFKLERELTFITLAGPGLASLGATAEVTHGGLPYDVPQQWSAALYKHPVRADGIAYKSRHDDSELCYAIFHKASSAISEVERILDIDANWFWEIAEIYDVGRAP